MKTSILAIPLLAAVASSSTTGKLGDAEVVKNRPGVAYEAVFSASNETEIEGFINGTSADDGTGVVWTLSLSSLPHPSLGPFLYHVHDQRVPADGNCTATLAHLDPYIRGEDPPCDPDHPETCQVGDLSGKFGDIPAGENYSTAYLDLYTSTGFGPASFFGNRSIVIHAFNKTRLACADFLLVEMPQITAPEYEDEHVSDCD